ncbi:MAG: hypothetical protein NC342_07085 [Pseudoflavonifractor sp.]|nr:hypothetical protein [Alloprevotella sp.]MCM1117282.1 hypothetical protein [Pseudoflavonifractor sp.]
MKRISLICTALIATLSMSAQKSLVDEVNKEYKSNSAAAQGALSKIQPALTNPETAQTPYAWYTAGKVAVAAYDDIYKASLLTPNDLPADKKKTAGNDMIAAYEYFMKALPLDQTPDEKGKVKPKYTKDIYKTLKDGYHDFQRAGIYLYEAQDYPGAVKAWDIYITLPSNPALADAKIEADPDTIIAQMMYYQGLAYAFDNKPELGVQSMRNAMATGFKSPELFQNALAVATQANDTVAMNEFAQKGYDIYGTQNIAFIGQLINERLNRGDYDGCVELVNQAIAAKPGSETEAQLYDILGCIDADQQKDDAAIANFDQAITLNPAFAKAYFDKARVIYNQAIRQWDDATEELRNSALKPQLLNAAELFEKAYELDEVNQTQVPGVLYRLFYLIEGEEGANTQKWHNM